MGDYKLMEHLLTGEQKLFNVVTDYGERHDLLAEKPEIAAQMKAVMSNYLKSIQAEDVQAVYKARFAELDRFEAMARSVHAKAIERAQGQHIRHHPGE